MKKAVLIIILCVFAIGGVALVVMYNLGDRLIAEAILNDLLSEENTAGDQPVESAKGIDNLQEQQKDNNLKPVETDNNSDPKESDENNKNKVDKPISKAPTKPALIDVQVNEIKDEVSASDKITAAALVIRRLSSSDVSQLKGMLTGGLSEEELAQAKALAYARFTEDEISQIKEMYAKYMK